MRELVAAVTIDARAETVWNILTDLPRFRDWNPFIREASGDTGAGGHVRVRVRSSFGLPLVLHADVLGCEVGRALRWRGHFGAPWLAEGEHTFTTEPAGDGRVRFTQREVFSGLIPRVAERVLARETLDGFDAMNRALRDRAEDAERARRRAPRAAQAPS